MRPFFHAEKPLLVGIDLSDAGEFLDTAAYTLRYPSDSVPNTGLRSVEVEELAGARQEHTCRASRSSSRKKSTNETTEEAVFNNRTRTASLRCRGDAYIHESAVHLQWALDMAFIELHADKTTPQSALSFRFALATPPDVRVRQLPKPDFAYEATSSENPAAERYLLAAALAHALTMLLGAGFGGFALILAGRAAAERECGHVESLHDAGLTDTLYELALLITHTLSTLPLAVLLIIVLKLFVLVNTNLIILAATMLLATLAFVALGTEPDR